MFIIIILITHKNCEIQNEKFKSVSKQINYFDDQKFDC
jgi:hypothetical protein